MDQARRTRDEWLALRCQANEPRAFEQLVEETRRPLLYYALKLTGNYDTAQEVIQDAWVRAIRSISKLKDASTVRAWLYRLVHGVAVDRVRRDVSRERAEDLHYAEIAESTDEWLAAEKAEEIHLALDQLAPKHREILLLFFLEQFSISEIAEIVACSAGTVKSRLHYAKDALRRILAHSHYEPKSK